jgi:Leucine-rich repeat (LRR) protein
MSHDADVVETIRRARRTNNTGLNLEARSLTTVPPEVFELSHLTSLILRNNRLTTLPPDIERLAALTNLLLDDNLLENLPPQIGRLRKLEFLALHRESVRGDQAAPFCESLPERGRFIDCLSSGVNGPVSDLWILRPIWNQSPLQRIERPRLSLGIESDRQNLLARGDIVTDG